MHVAKYITNAYKIAKGLGLLCCSFVTPPLQAGNPSPSLEDLKKAPQPPIPKLAALEEAMQMPFPAREPPGIHRRNHVSRSLSSKHTSNKT